MTRPTPSPITDLRLDRLIRDVLAERAQDVAVRAVTVDAMRGRLSVRTRQRLPRPASLLIAAGLVAALILGGLAATGSMRPPAPTDTMLGLLHWTGPLRTDTSGMPVIPLEQGFTELEQGFTDGEDAASGYVDIIKGGAVGRRWDVVLAASPPRAAADDPVRLIIEYGIVLDANADGLADCHLGLNNDADVPGELRLWVRNLTTGVESVLLGPPYGRGGLDFRNPEEGSRTMSFFFLRGGGAPCQVWGTSPMDAPRRFYAYASATEDGRVVAWDYAPDAAWLDTGGH